MLRLFFSFADQSFGLNALATLAEVTLNGLMPSPTAESGNSSLVAISESIHAVISLAFQRPYQNGAGVS